jgi:FkbM family methyltransferase
MIKPIKDKDGGEFWVIDGDTHGSKWAEEQQRLDYDRSVEDALRFIKPGHVVIDAGANIGAYSVPFAKAVGEHGFVLAFEPMPDAFDCLSLNLAPFKRSLAMNAALDKQAGEIFMEADKNAGASHVSAKKTGITAKTVTIDSFGLSSLHFIKMDIEGFEPYALAGAMETIQKFKPIILVELNDEALGRNGFIKNDVLLPLLKIGYRFELLDSRTNLNMPQIDVFLMP